jgi:hypothetical protein
MTDAQEKLLREHGWEIFERSPMRIRHKMSGGEATGFAVESVIRDAEAQSERDQSRQWPAQLEGKRFEELVDHHANAFVLAILLTGAPKLSDKLNDAYREVDTWQVANGIRKAQRAMTKYKRQLGEDVTLLVDAFIREGSKGVRTRLFTLMCAFAESK